MANTIKDVLQGILAQTGVENADGFELKIGGTTITVVSEDNPILSQEVEVFEFTSEDGTQTTTVRTTSGETVDARPIKSAEAGL